MKKPPQLPDDVDALKALLIEKNSHIDQLEVKVLTLQEQFNLAIAKRYAASSEKISPDQFRLFDETEVETDDESSPLENDDHNSTTVVEHTHTKKTGRKRLPKSLVRVDEIHELGEAERIFEYDGNILKESVKSSPNNSILFQQRFK